MLRVWTIDLLKEQCVLTPKHTYMIIISSRFSLSSDQTVAICGMSGVLLTQFKKKIVNNRLSTSLSLIKFDPYETLNNLIVLSDMS